MNPSLSPWDELPAIFALGGRDRKAIQSYQERKLLSLVAEAYSTSAFYRRLWNESGFDPRRFRGMEDLARIPRVTKQAARSLAEEIRRHPSADRLIWHKTSGSTGEPLALARTWSEERFLTVVRQWLMRSMGFRAHLRRGRIRVPADFDWIDDRPLWILNALGLYRSRIISCFQPPEQMWEQLKDYAPDIVLGYSETVTRVARYGLEAQRNDVRPRLVMIGGELCTPRMRHQIVQGFQAPVCEIYASTEFNLLAWSCVQSGLLHICDPTVIVEVLDDGGEPVADGETGRAVVTALHSRVMPFIRFELGDLVVKGPAQCPCGAPYGTLHSVDGREIDRLRLKNGETLHAYALLNTLLACDVSWIRQYQLVQNEPGVVHLRVWPLHPPSEEVLARLQGQLEEKCAGLEIRIKLVDGMDLDAAGKFHLCVVTGSAPTRKH